MGLFTAIKSDLRANSGNSKGKVIVVSYRLANYFSQNESILIRVIGFPFVKFYHWTFIWLMGVEIPDRTKIGGGFQVWHGSSLVINANTVIGNNVLLRHSTTIGNKGLDESCPVIGDNVNIGSNSVLIGKITIGNNVTIGAGSIVTKSIPDNSVAYGNPVKIFPQKNSLLQDA